MDEDGSTVIDTYRTFADVITTPTVTTVKTTTTEHTLWTDGKTTTSDITTSKDGPLVNIVSTETRKEHINTISKVEKTTKKVFKGESYIYTTYVIEPVYSFDSDSVTTKKYKIYADTITTPITTSLITETIERTLWKDGSITDKVVDVSKSSDTVEKTTISHRKELIDIITTKVKEYGGKDGQDLITSIFKTQYSGNFSDLDDLEIKKLSERVCHEIKIRGITFKLEGAFQPSGYNWNDWSKLKKINNLVSKCLNR